MSARPSFGVVIPATGPFGAPGVFAAIVDAIEGLGYDDVWFGDHVAVPSYAAHITEPDWLEPITCCLLALGRTTRLRAGTDVLVLPYRNPVLVAKMAATADALSSGRLVLGVGVGYLKGEFAALGAPYERRGAISDEYLRVMCELWASGGKPVSFDGEFVAFDHVCLGPAPASGRVPVWVGGNAPAAWRRAAVLGDGWHPLFPNADEYRRGRDAIVAMRTPSERFVFSISLATTHVLEPEGAYSPSVWADLADVPEDFGYAPAVPVADDGRVRFVGVADEVAADVEEYVAAGVEHFTLRFSTGGKDAVVTDYFDQLQRFAEEVMPRFRQGFS
jgi:probable F420-dependent oxidoreductase